jgi:hypothetical protein
MPECVRRDLPTTLYDGDTGIDSRGTSPGASTQKPLDNVIVIYLRM